MRKETGQLKKNEYRKYFFAAVGVAIIVFACVGVIMLNYSITVRRELYETSSKNLNEVYTQVSEKFMQITGQQWNLLGMTGDYIDEAGENIDSISKFLTEWKNEWHYTEFYFIDDACNYLSSSGKKGYLELGNTWKSLVIDRKNVVVDGSLPGSDEVMFFAIPVQPAYISGFKYSSIAVSYNTEAINKELGIKAFSKDTSSYVIYANGDIVLKSEGGMDIGGNIFYHLKNADISGKSLDGFMKSVKNSDAEEMVFRLDENQYCLVYVPIGFDNWGLISMVPISVANSSSLAVQHRTVIMAVQIGILLLMVACVVLYTYYKRYVSEKDHEIARRDILFSIMAKNLDDVYIMLSWGDWRKLYVSRNIERVLGIRSSEYDGILKDFGELEKRGEVPEWNDIVKLGKGESAVNEYWIKPADSSEYRLFNQGCYHMDKDGDDVLVIILSDRTYEQQIRNHMEDALHTAEAANRAKSQFLSNMSHDIRTPMNAIVGFSQLMLRHYNNPDKVRNYSEKIVVSSQHLLSLINDVLDMSKIESGKTTLNLCDVNLADIINETDNIIRPQAKKKNQTFVVKSDGVEYCCITADKLRLSQILINILSNAVKYTEEGGNITFEIKEIKVTNPQIVKYKFIISDNGIGMSEEYLKDIFKPFTREETSLTDAVQGTGLGMAITKNLIDLMGGTIKVLSTQGVGTTYEVTMEFRIADINTNKDLWNRYNIPKHENEPDHVLVGKNFLIAEDNGINSDMLKELLKEEGAACDCAKNGMATVDLFRHSKKGQYDLIFMDVQMPDMDGYEATRAIRQMKHPDAKDIPIVAMTANAFSNDVKAAFDCGMNAHLAKPVNIDRIKDIVANFT